MIVIKIELEAMNQTWRVNQIVIDKDGVSHFVPASEESFPVKELAERDAQSKARTYLQTKFGIEDGDIIWQIFPPV